MKSATLALLALLTSSLACIERAQPCDNGTFEGEINQGIESVSARDYEGNAWGYALGDEARERFAKCRTVTGHLYGHAIDDSYFPNLESLGSIGTFDPWDKYQHLPLLTGWDQLTELGGVLGTVDRIEGFSQIRRVDVIEGLDVVGFNNLEHVGELDVSNVSGLISLESAGSIRLSYTADAAASLLPSLRAVAGDFVVARSQLTQLSLSGLSEIGGDFGVSGNDFLSSFSGFSVTSKIAGSVYFVGNWPIRNDAVQSALARTVIGGDVFICSNGTVEPAGSCPDGFVNPVKTR